MKILAIDTSSTACSVALADNEDLLERHEIIGNRHSRELLGFVQALLIRAGTSLYDLDAIAIGNGPGSFTGLRLGLGVAQGLAWGADLPLIPVSSLAAMAAQSNQPYLLTAADARMGEVYWQCFKRSVSGLPAALTEPELARPTEVSPPKIDGNWHGTGSGWVLYHSSLAPLLADERDWTGDILPRASAIARLAEQMIQTHGFDSIPPAIPEYVRNKVTGTG